MTDARLTDTRLRELYARRLDAARRTGERCPEPDALLAVVRGEGEEDVRLATLDHVMACGECSREFELLRALDRANAESASGVVTPAVAATPIRRPASWRRYAPVALAASVLVLIGVSLLSRDGGRGVTRGDRTAVALISPRTEVEAGAPIVFVWRPVSDALRYELEVLDASGSVAYSASTADTAATVPLSTLTPDVDYRWWVRAATGAGDQRASEMRRLRVRRQ